MTDSYFIHFHGASDAGERLIAALSASLAAAPGRFVLHTPVAMPGEDPLPVEQDARLALCQMNAAAADGLAAQLDALGRSVEGVHAIGHQRMAREIFRSGTPAEPFVSFIVQYNGPARDPAAFHAYYRAHHIPIVERMPGIRTISYFTPVRWDAPRGIDAVDYLQLVQVTFDDVDALQTMRRSPQRREGLRDFANYPPFEGPVTHQGMLGRSR